MTDDRGFISTIRDMRRLSVRRSSRQRRVRWQRGRPPPRTHRLESHIESVVATPSSLRVINVCIGRS
jgi:hypothetical protein